MPALSLRQLDKHTIAIELTVQHEKRLLRGVGRFEAEGDLGPALHVGVEDVTGNFELILRESQWNGQIGPGQPFDCDFAIQLDASCLCSQ